MERILREKLVLLPCYCSFSTSYFQKILWETSKKLTLKEKKIWLESEVGILESLYLTHNRYRRPISIKEKLIFPYRDTIYEELFSIVRIISIKRIPSWVCIYLVKWRVQSSGLNPIIHETPDNASTKTPNYVIPHDVFNKLSSPPNWSKDVFKDVPYIDLVNESWEKWLLIVSRDRMNGKKPRVMIRWVGWQVINDLILDICLAMAPLDLPAYVLLEILDYVPFIGNQDHGLKIKRIIQIRKLIREIKKRRKAKIDVISN